MTLTLTNDELLTTTRAVRLRLDFEKSVPRDVLTDCLRIALQAPSASDAQDWQWVFVEDVATKAALGDIYRANLAGSRRSKPRDEKVGQSRIATSGAHLATHIQEAPVLLVPCLKGRVDNSPSAFSATFWASVMPAVWSFCLALRSRGMGTCWTTLHLFGEGERAAAELLGIPHDAYSQVGMFPIAYTKGVDFKPAQRLRPESVMHWNGW